MSRGRKGIKIHQKDAILERLKSETVYKDDCWKWIGCTEKSGYGKISLTNIKYSVHRLSAYIFLGLDINSPILQALHKPECKNKNCWNPEHLYIGSYLDNMQDVSNKSTFRCGHEKSISNSYYNGNGYACCRQCCLKYSNMNSNRKRIQNVV